MCSVSRAHEEEEKSCIGREKFSDLYNRDCCLLLLLCCRAITILTNSRRRYYMHPKIQQQNFSSFVERRDHVLSWVLGEQQRMPKKIPTKTHSAQDRTNPAHPMKHHPVHKTPFATTQIRVEKQKSERKREREMGKRSHPQRFRLRLWWTPSRCAPTLAHAPSSPQSPYLSQISASANHYQAHRWRKQPNSFFTLAQSQRKNCPNLIAFLRHRWEPRNPPVILDWITR